MRFHRNKGIRIQNWQMQRLETRWKQQQITPIADFRLLLEFTAN